MYTKSSRQLKRFDSTTKSPIFSHFRYRRQLTSIIFDFNITNSLICSETIAGTSTIRAYNKVGTFEKESKSKIDINNRTNWYSFQGSRWLGFYLELLCSLILLVVSIQLVIQKDRTSSGEGKFKEQF